MPHLDLTDEERAALLPLIKKALDTDRYPLSPRLYPLRSILEKLEPQALLSSCAVHTGCDRGTEIMWVATETIRVIRRSFAS